MSMAKAKEIAGLDSVSNALDWAVEVLRVRFEKVLSLREKALDQTDIEGVHEMRVAIRRLRSALHDFSPLLKLHPLRKTRKDLKKIADMLGAARDQDVAIAALARLSGKTQNKHIKADIENKLEKRRAFRQETQNQLEKNLDPFLLEALRERFAKAIDAIIRKDGKAAEITAKQAGFAVISKSIQDFCKLSESLYTPFDQTKLHELRISAKRLRYAIELFTGCWDEKIEPFAKEVSEMQNFLGELHDCDIWIENLSQRLLKEKGDKQRADFWLLSKFVKKRTKNYRAALRLWSKWQKNRFMKRLQEVLETDS